MNKSKDTSASKQIFDYLVDQNRPYSAIDIFNNLHKEHGKTAVVKVLEQLVSDDKIKEKTYGKQKIYYANQSKLPDSKDIDLRQLDAEVNNLTLTLTETQKNLTQAETVMGTLRKSLTTAEAESELDSINAEIPVLKAKLNDLDLNAVNISPQEIDAVYRGKQKYSKEKQQRKRMANDMIDAILEGYPKRKKQLLEELDIETDEDLNLEKI